MTNTDYNKHHLMVKTLIKDMKNICDDYIGRRTDEETLRYYVQFWASNCPELMFNGHTEYNSTLKQRVGSKRLKLINKMLAGTQLTL